MTGGAGRRDMPGEAVEGLLSARTELVGGDGRKYLKGRLAITRGPREGQSVTAMAFGAAAERVGAGFADGPVRLYGVFEPNCYRVISMGLPDVRRA